MFADWLKPGYLRRFVWNPLLMILNFSLMEVGILFQPKMVSLDDVCSTDPDGTLWSVAC